MKKLFATAALLCAAQSHAATLIKTGTTNNRMSGAVDKFDPKLGTLNSISITQTLTYSQTWLYEGDPAGGEQSLSVKWTGNGTTNLGVIDMAASYSLVSRLDQPIRTETTATGTSLYDSSSALFQQLIGTDDFYVAFLFPPVITLYNDKGSPVARDLYLGGRGGSAFDSFQVVYDYTPVPPVPEPATWTMMLAGFGLIGAWSRRRALPTGDKNRPVRVAPTA